MKTIVKKSTISLPPHKVYDILHDLPYCAILDSSLTRENRGFSVVGINPYCILKEEQGITHRNGIPLDQSFEEELSAILRENREENPWDLPLISGGIGYFSYDFGRKFEDIPCSHPRAVKIPEAMFVFYDNFLIFDHTQKEWYLTAKGMIESGERSICRVENLLKTEAPRQRETSVSSAKISFDHTEKEYLRSVEAIIEHIREGDIYIANLTQQMTAETDLPPYELFRRIRETNPSPFGGYLNYGSFQVVSASPERFLRIADGEIETKPIKGTRRRGATADEDAALRRELECSQKDRSELLMIVDLERNDLNRICEPGSVRVTKHFDIESYATVFHLVSTVKGTLCPNIGYDEILKAVFPGGSITGAPKIEAMKVIDSLEHSARGLYTGSMGYISFDGNCDLNIVIRTAVHRNGKYHIGIGGGITFESDPAAEYEESLQKAKAFRDLFQRS